MFSETSPGPAFPSRRVLAVLLPSLLLMSCVPAPPSSSQTGVSLERFYGQELALEACETAVPTTGVPLAGQCGHVTVPIDYANPDGGTAEIAVFRIPARNSDPIGSLFINPGGPGLPGIAYSAEVANAWATNPVTSRFDLVGFDPRGTGASTPAIDCFTDAEREAGALTASQLTLPDTPSLVEACAAGVGGVEVLAHLGTRDAARDLDVMRAVFGDDGLTYVGQSYGTRLGAVYAEMFAQNVRALVLDGAMDPQTGTAERRLVQWAGLQGAFEGVAAFCAEQDQCPLGAQAESATRAYQALVRPLIETPVPAGTDRVLTWTAANDAVVTGLYNAAAWPVVVAGLAQLAEGRGDILLAMRDVYHERSTDGSYADSAEAALAIDCLDEERFSPEEQAMLVDETLAAAPFLDPGTPTRPVPDMCEGWPAAPTLGFPYASDIDGLPTTLTVSVTGDAVTPHSGGISLAAVLGGSLLTVEGAQHGSLIAGNECIDTAAAAYLIDLTPPSVGASCQL